MENEKFELHIRNALSDKTLDSLHIDDLCCPVGILLYLSGATSFKITANTCLSTMLPEPKDSFFASAQTTYLENLYSDLCALAGESNFKVETVKDFINLYIKAKNNNSDELLELSEKSEELMTITTGDVKKLNHFILLFSSLCTRRNILTWHEYIENLLANTIEKYKTKTENNTENK